MQTIRLELLDPNQVVYVPISGENEVTEIVIDMSHAYHDFPEGSGEIWFKRADGETYLKDITQAAGVLTAVLTDVDTAISGIARAQGWWVDGSHLKKSPEYRLGIHQSFTTPDEIRSARQQALTLLAQCEDLLAEMTQTRTDTYEARDQALAARDEAMESAENASQSELDAEALVQAATDYMDIALAAVERDMQTASDAAASALNSADSAQREKNSAQTAATNAAIDRAAIAGTLNDAQQAALAAQQYSQLAMQEHNGADEAYRGALAQQDLAQEARRDAQAAQLLAEDAKNKANSAMNSAAESAGQADKIYDDFLLQYNSIDTRLTALENAVFDES